MGTTVDQNKGAKNRAIRYRIYNLGIKSAILSPWIQTEDFWSGVLIQIT